MIPPSEGIGIRKRKKGKKGKERKEVVVKKTKKGESVEELIEEIGALVEIWKQTKGREGKRWTREIVNDRQMMCRVEGEGIVVREARGLEKLKYYIGRVCKGEWRERKEGRGKLYYEMS